MTNDLDIPAFLKISQARRKAAWRDYKPHPSPVTTSIERWKRYELDRQREAKEKTQARIAMLRESKGLDPFYA